MQFKVAVEGTSAKDIHAKLLFAASQFGAAEEVDAIDVSTLRSGKPSKADEEEFDLGGDEAPAPVKAPTLEKVLAAFAHYVKPEEEGGQGNPREAAVKILKKFGVKSAKLIEPKDFAKALKLLSA